MTLAFLSFGEEFSYLIEGRRSLHFFFHLLLYPVIFLSHGSKLPLFILEALLHVVSLLPVLDESLHFGYRKNVVFEIVYNLQKLILRTRWFPGAAVRWCSAVGNMLTHFLIAIVVPRSRGIMMTLLANALRRCTCSRRW